MSNGATAPTPEQQVADSIQRGTFQLSPQLYGGGAGSQDAFWFRYDDGRLPLAGWWSRRRDYDLRQYVRSSDMLSAIVAQRCSQIRNTNWKLVANDKSLEPLLPHYYKLLNAAHFGEGFRTFLELFTADHHTQDNGAFMELIGPGQQIEYEQPYLDQDGNITSMNRFTALGYLPKEQIIGIAQVDASRVWRTYNKEFPFVYENAWTGRRYIMHRTRMVGRAQFRQPIERGRGLGFCSTSRAFAMLELIKASNDYSYEKMIGQSPELAVVRAINIQAIRDAFEAAKLERDAKGTVRYKGTTYLEADSIEGVQAGIDIVGLKGVPDGWDRPKELQMAMLIVSAAFLTDPRDLGWNIALEGQTKADAEIQDLKTSGRGRADTMRDIEEILSNYLLPEGIALEFDNKDDGEDKRKAEIAKIRAETRQIQVTIGEINAGESRELAARDGDIEASFLETQTVMEADTNPTAEPLSPADNSAEVAQAQHETLPPTFKAYNNEVRIPFQDDLLQVLLHEVKTPYDKALEIQDLTYGYGTSAYIQGINDGGAQGIDLVSELEREEASEMNALLRVMYDRALPLALDAVDMDLPQIQDRVALWANKGLDSLYDAGLLAGAANQNMEWIYGDAKHCKDCAKLNGRVYRAKTWKKWGIVPRSSELECKGFRCDCHLEKTSKPALKGRPPKLSGQKWYQFWRRHSHEH